MCEHMNADTVHAEFHRHRHPAEHILSCIDQGQLTLKGVVLFVLLTSNERQQQDFAAPNLRHILVFALFYLL